MVRGKEMGNRDENAHWTSIPHPGWNDQKARINQTSEVFQTSEVWLSSFNLKSSAFVVDPERFRSQPAGNTK